MGLNSWKKIRIVRILRIHKHIEIPQKYCSASIEVLFTYWKYLLNYLSVFYFFAKNLFKKQNYSSDASLAC